MPHDKKSQEQRPHSKPRFLYRFDNFSKEFLLLKEAVTQLKTGKISKLEQEGTVQRFEYCWELAWKL